MTERPRHGSLPSKNETVTIEVDRETAELLEGLPQVDAEIHAETSNPSKGDQPQATTESLKELLEPIQNPEKREVIGKSKNHYIKHFIALKFSFNLKISSAQGYISALNEYTEQVPSGENTCFLEADWGDFKSYIRYLIKNRNRWKTFKGKINLLKQFYSHLEAEFRTSFALDMAYLRRFEPIKYKPELPDPLQREPLEPEEMRTLVDSADSLRDRLILRLLYQTSMRNSEIRNLKIDHFDRDIDNPLIKIVDAKFGKDRHAPVLQELALDLEHWIDVERSAFSAFAPESEYLFPTRRGVKFESNQGILQRVRKAADEAELQEKIGERADGVPKHRIDAHVLRHTGNTHWKQSGIGIKKRMEILGHEDEKTTEGYSPSSDSVSFTEFREQFDPVI